MLGNRRWLSLLLVVTLASFAVGIAAYADSGAEGEFLAKINASRASAGLAPLKLDSGLTTYARHHTADMIASGGIYHSSSGELKSAGGSGWQKLGENVGRGQTPSSLHSAFMNSAGHKANILGDYNYVGIGADGGDGYLYVTVIFMKKGSTTAAKPTTTTTTPAAPGNGGGATVTPVKAAPATAAQTTSPTTSPTTTTTLAPTTTTTLIVPPDKPVTPGQTCIEAGRYYQLCQD
jgi:Cysteine-rich secretory protein family